MNAPLAHPLVADGWSTEYSFDELEIEVDGIFFGSFSGTATLALDNRDDLWPYVKAIAVKGCTRKPFVRSGGFRDTRMMETVLLLEPKEVDPAKAVLFAKIRDAIEASEQAGEWFRKELGGE